MDRNMGDKIAVNQKALDIGKAVREFVAENARGCPKGVLQYKLNFHPKDIQLAVDCNLIESGRGKEGGYFPAGEKPEAQERASVTLKSRMADALKVVADGGTLDSDFAQSLLNEYAEECKGRAEAIAKAKAEKAAATA